MKFYLKMIIVTVTVASFACLFLFIAEKSIAPGFLENKIKGVCFKEHCFKVEVADSENKRKLGLMNRQSLPEDTGMLFLFEKEGIYSFWMKDTFIPLDIIWIDKNNEIVFIKKDAEPCLQSNCVALNPEGLAKYVLEINAGQAEKLKLEVLDKAIFVY